MADAGSYDAVTHVEMEAVRVAAVRVLSRYGLDSLSANLRVEMANMIGGDIALMFKSMVYGAGRETWKCEWPTTWWQHFKQRWFPRWALRRWPVQMEQKSGLVWGRVCPHLDLPMDRDRHVMWLADREQDLAKWRGPNGSVPS